MWLDLCEDRMKNGFHKNVYKRFYLCIIYLDFVEHCANNGMSFSFICKDIYPWFVFMVVSRGLVHYTGTNKITLLTECQFCVTQPRIIWNYVVLNDLYLYWKIKNKTLISCQLEKQPYIISISEPWHNDYLCSLSIYHTEILQVGIGMIWVLL